MDYSHADLYNDAVQIFTAGRNASLTDAVTAVLKAKRYIINQVKLTEVFSPENAIPEPETTTPDKR